MAKRMYGWSHQQKRAALLPFAIGTPCIYCGGLMLEWMKLDLDHSTGKITHASCNRRAGAKYGNALRGLRRKFSSIYYGR